MFLLGHMSGPDLGMHARTVPPLWPHNHMMHMDKRAPCEHPTSLHTRVPSAPRPACCRAEKGAPPRLLLLTLLQHYRRRRCHGRA